MYDLDIERGFVHGVLMIPTDLVLPILWCIRYVHGEQVQKCCHRRSSVKIIRALPGERVWDFPFCGYETNCFRIVNFLWTSMR